ncbi:hypothetical protein NLI96_g3883 [Meripilus lineatus]|uniref:Uncharacterized protein n=1 Tax=Meripilus lineatus TaxID=2056292 RepID=A0AAD5VBC6_9APHY|nr:hypothetical protein NLI96_g3883 [Physisporinus lineatus]
MNSLSRPFTFTPPARAEYGLLSTTIPNKYLPRIPDVEMSPLHFVLTIVIGLTVFVSLAESKPAPYYSIRLTHCDAAVSNTSVAERCASACESVRLAQTSCYGVPSCTCSTASAEAVKTCLECHIREEPHILDEEAIVTITSRVTAYSLICDSLLGVRTSSDDLKMDITPSSNITRREDDQEKVCLFGLPDIIFPEPSTFTVTNSRSPWLYLVFAIVVVAYMVEARRKSSHS